MQGNHIFSLTYNVLTSCLPRGLKIIRTIQYRYPKRQILESSKLKEFADDNFKLDENGRRFSKWIKKNTVEKGEIARYELFLLFPQCFQKACTAFT